MEIVIGSRPIRSAQARIDALRARTGQSDDALTSPHHLVHWARRDRHLPLVLLMHREGVLFGAALLILRCRLRFPIGLAWSGNLAGQGGVIAAPADRVSVLEAAARVLFRYTPVHTVLLSLLWTRDTPVVPSRPLSQMEGQWHFRDVRVRLDLSGGFEATMERLSYKMRRNLRYYRRKAETDFGCRFLPEMNAEQRRDAVHALSNLGTYPKRAGPAYRFDAALQSMPGQFAMALQDRDGRWLSYLAGWRGLDGTAYIDWQINSEDHSNLPMSTVLRGYLLEHEAARSCPAVVFVGCTSPFWSRVCDPGVCGDLLAVRPGVFGSLMRRVINLISPNGQIAKLLRGQSISV